MKKQGLKNLIWLIIILVVFSIVTQFTGQSSISLNFGDAAMTANGPDQFSYTVDYDRVQSVELVELTDAGTILSGEETRRCAWGERENAAWGTYTLCVYAKVDAAILLTMQDGEKLVFNCEEAEITESMAKEFAQMLEDRKTA